MGAFSTKNNAASTHSTPSKDQGEKSFFGVQAKLTIGKSNDKYETQADALADKVVSKKETKTNQTFFSPAFLLIARVAGKDPREYLFLLWSWAGLFRFYLLFSRLSAKFHQRGN